MSRARAAVRSMDHGIKKSCGDPTRRRAEKLLGDAVLFAHGLKQTGISRGALFRTIHTPERMVSVGRGDARAFDSGPTGEFELRQYPDRARRNCDPGAANTPVDSLAHAVQLKSKIGIRS